MKEIEVMTNDLGKVTADCQFCGTQYILSPSELVKKYLIYILRLSFEKYFNFKEHQTLS